MPKRSRDFGVASLLDVEAREDGDEEEGLSDEQDEVADAFINDDDEEEDFPDPLTLVRNHGSSPPRSVEFDAEATARRIQERSRREGYGEEHRVLRTKEREGFRSALIYEDHLSSSLLHIWMIRSRSGFDDAERISDHLPEPAYAFAVHALPGRVYIRAPSVAIIRDACKNLAGLEHAPLLSIPLDEQHQVLSIYHNETSSSLPIHEVGDWVTIRRGLYRGDLARVRAVTIEDDSIIVAVVPRIGCKNQTARPEARPFDAEAISKLYAGESVKTISESEYQFRRRRYVNNLCELKVSSIHFLERARPSLSDLGYFALLERSLGELDRGEPFLRVGDRVRTTSGPHVSLQGLVGAIYEDSIVILNLVDSASNVKLSQLWMPAIEVRRILKPGDHIRTRVGPRVEGIVMTVDNETISVFDAESSTVQQTRMRWVETYEPEFRMAQEPVASSSRLPRIFDEYKGHRIYVRHHRELKGTYGYVHSSDPTKKVAQIARDGSNNGYLHVVELKDLISVHAVACLDGAHPLTEEDQKHYFTLFNLQVSTRSTTPPRMPHGAERPLPNASASPRGPERLLSDGSADCTSPASSQVGMEVSAWTVDDMDKGEHASRGDSEQGPPLNDFSGPGMWIFLPKVLAYQETYHIHFSRVESSRPIFTERNFMDSADHSECWFAHHRCKLRVTAQNSSLSYRTEHVLVGELLPKRPLKNQIALVIQGSPDLIGSVVTVRGFTRERGVYKTASVIDAKKNRWPPLPIENLTRVELLSG